MRQTLAHRRLFEGADSVLVGCSGGPDSQVLLHALHALREVHGARLSAAGVDHGLRPEAPSELALAAELAAELGVPFTVLKVQVPPGASRQAQARRARYEALLGHARALGAARVAVGHTRDDQAETVLAQLIRGTSLDGLRGIAPRRSDGVVRPLFDVPRSAVHAYARRHDLRFALDPSNQDTRYLRVRVRTRLLPQLVQENPRIAEQLSALAEDAREVAELLATEVERARTLLDAGSAAIREESGYVRRCALKAIVQENTGRMIQRTHLAALDRMLERGGQVRLPGDYVASLDTEGRLCFSRVPKRGRGGARPTPGTHED